jgi:DNA replication and repair protein RecF
VQISRLELKNFRCFDTKTLDLDAPLVLIQGNNGSGKTSLLEALHYMGYLRSFRTSNSRELIKLDSTAFFIKAICASATSEMHELQVGFSPQKRLVKVNQSTVSSFKELMDFYRIVTLTEDDLALVKEGPAYRRSFIDHALILLEPELLITFKEFKKIVDQRNALLQRSLEDNALYAIWTEKLWHSSQIIARKRMELLAKFEVDVNELSKSYVLGDVAIAIAYSSKVESTAAMCERRFREQEFRFKRSLFGAHLDDYIITFENKQSRFYASRGQQKLIVLLFKIAFLRALSVQRGPALFVLDDFMTDFDEERVRLLIPLITSLSNQLIFTSPAQEGFFEKIIMAQGAQKFHLG